MQVENPSRHAEYPAPIRDISVNNAVGARAAPAAAREIFAASRTIGVAPLRAAVMPAGADDAARERLIPGAVTGAVAAFRATRAWVVTVRIFGTVASIALRAVVARSGVAVAVRADVCAETGRVAATSDPPRGLIGGAAKTLDANKTAVKNGIIRFILCIVSIL